ncbi:transposase, partial [Streptomyces sp. YIM 98790]
MSPRARRESKHVAPPSRYSPEFREEAVHLALKSSRPIAHVARELD